jgi:uncharacterized protein YqeY
MKIVNVVEQLQQKMIQAMKAKNAIETGTLRLLLARVKNDQIELQRELSEAEFLEVVQKEIKQRRDSIDQFVNANRNDLAQSETAELGVLLTFMPEQLSTEQVMVEIDKAADKVQPAGLADMGKMMVALSHLKDQANMSDVSKMVRQMLQGRQ